MTCRGLVLLGIAICWGGAAEGYTRTITSQGVALYRPDATAIQFLVHSGFSAGAVNSEGGTTITAGSNPAAALAAAASTWTAVPTATVRFLPFKPTTLGHDGSDGQHVITMEDTPENRSVVGAALAVTLSSFRLADGAIMDTDIVVNPKIMEGTRQVAFSTLHEAGTYDLRSTLTHELGHALGASHSGVIGATMYQQAGETGTFISANEADAWATLSADDVAFVNSVYPGIGVPSQVGTISGMVKFDTGTAVMGAMVFAADPAQGIILGAIASRSDGNYAIGMVPPGQYQVYAQPMDGPVRPGNFTAAIFQGLTPMTSFRTTFSGGNANPAAIPVMAGAAAKADIAVAAGASTLHIDHLGVGTPGQTDWAYGDVKAIAAGGASDILIWGPGLNSTVTEDNLVILGPGMTLRPGSLRTAPYAASGGMVPLRFTVDVAPYGSRSPVAVAVVKGTEAAADSGSLLLLPGGMPAVLNTGVFNAASFEDGPVSPGGIVTIYGSGFGPPSGLALAGLDANGKIAGQIAGVRVLFDGHESPLIYAGGNVVSAVVPFEAAGRKSTAMTVESNGVASTAVNLGVAAASPALFTYHANGSGQVLAVNPDGSFNLPGTPADRGSVVVMYWTGAGLMSPQVGDGELTPGLARPVLPFSVTVGGVPASAIYAGAAPGEVAGLEQLNVTIPAGVAPGDAAVVLTVGEYSSRGDVTVAVR